MEWIPVSEKLPKDDAPVLITIAVNNSIMAMGVPGHIAFYDCDCGWQYTGGMSVGYPVVAWVPLPEPYEVG